MSGSTPGISGRYNKMMTCRVSILHWGHRIKIALRAVHAGALFTKGNDGITIRTGDVSTNMKESPHTMNWNRIFIGNWNMCTEIGWSAVEIGSDGPH
jgi:hypothetical protein